MVGRVRSEWGKRDKFRTRMVGFGGGMDVGTMIGKEREGVGYERRGYGAKNKWKEKQES